MDSEVETIAKEIFKIPFRMWKEKPNAWKGLDEDIKESSRAIARWHLKELRKAELRAKSRACHETWALDKEKIIELIKRTDAELEQLERE